MADAFAVLEELRNKHPKQFETLCTQSTSFQREVKLRLVENVLCKST